MGRMPTERSRALIFLGEGKIFTSLTPPAMYLGQRSLSLTSTLTISFTGAPGAS